jgi:hypothetical protein
MRGTSHIGGVTVSTCLVKLELRAEVPGVSLIHPGNFINANDNLALAA